MKVLTLIKTLNLSCALLSPLRSFPIRGTPLRRLRRLEDDKLRTRRHDDVPPGFLLKRGPPEVPRGDPLFCGSTDVAARASTSQPEKHLNFLNFFKLKVFPIACYLLKSSKLHHPKLKENFFLILYMYIVVHFFL